MNISRLYTFINNKNGFMAHFIEGHNLIDQISEIHNIGPYALEFYKKAILSSEQLITFLKPGEHLGFYIDSEEPYFRFKIEMSQFGTLRTLLLPEEFSKLPANFTGKCRVHKIYQNKSPYTSVLEFNDHPVEDIVNEVMEKSYQTDSRIFISKDNASSMMLTKLPPTNMNKKIDDFEDISLKEYKLKISGLLSSSFELKYTSVEEVVALFEKYGLSYLGSREVKFECPCSHQRMVENLFTLGEADREDIFKDTNSIDTRCDYCNTIYSIKKTEVLSPLS